MEWLLLIAGLFIAFGALMAVSAWAGAAAEPYAKRYKEVYGENYLPEGEELGTKTTYVGPLRITGYGIGPEVQVPRFWTKEKDPQLEQCRREWVRRFWLRLAAFIGVLAFPWGGLMLGHLVDQLFK